MRRSLIAEGVLPKSEGVTVTGIVEIGIQCGSSVSWHFGALGSISTGIYIIELAMVNCS